MWRSFFCALVATVTLSAMNPYRSGKLVLFQVTYDRDWHFFEIMFFIILGIFGVSLLLCVTATLSQRAAGSVRRVRRQIQHASRGVQTEAPGQSRRRRSSIPCYHYRHDRLVA